MNQFTSRLLRLTGIVRPAPRTRLGRWVRRAERVFTVVGVAYLILLAHPQPLFAHSVTAHDITVYARHPLSPAAIDRLAEARALVNRSELAVPHRAEQVFVCDNPWLYRMFAPLAATSFAISQNFTDNIFIAEADMAADQATSSSGSRRPLSGVIAHEITHGLIRQRLGYWRPLWLPEWVVEGYCDYVARSSTLTDAEGRRLLVADQQPMSPALRYFRNRQMVTYLIDQQYHSFNQVVARSGDEAQVAAATRQALAASP